MDIGQKLRELRKTNNLTLEELASRSELTKGFLSQVERNLTSPSISTLEDILEALGTSLSDFFTEEEEAQIVFSKEEDWFEDEKDDYKISWVIPNAQKNEMEPILLTLYPGKESFEVINHQGQEFGYVLEGNVILELEGGKKLRIKAAQSFYLDGKRSHKLINASRSQLARILWVSTPPIF
ncbi:helix-turn-helix domain-containing protein [Ileibacterium valens]|uniref:Cro/Cl family transcriptional regulator n=1 Tax=Ileibacterium valens TaxID=1862668 RepID=A0A1U7NEL8_9FIRM|nr:helix-turn-helix domain-containing protein [Ileibacterium valens]OLU38081.1 Cro/Cl family transcriptional regulator [Ileibacterium valens]OLU39860.1 Cro/Cl family transcriptional regulator [Erysipelotrichaceae bacterium NYU-BL-F16]OLU43154.1 Cro/Cl family transcriptional regulator [Erysipelotrichaceae bacterium NYU-BL-E8]